MNKALNEKVIVVTGAAGSVGTASVKEMTEQGAFVAALDLSADKVSQALAEANVDTSNVLALSCDITNAAAVKDAAKAVMDKFGKVDVLFNNAGIVGDAKPILDMAVSDLELVLNINVVGTYTMTIAFGNIMKEQGYGRIINTGSVSGIEADYGASAYCMSKAAVEILTQGIAVEMGEFGVSAVTIAPGPIDNAMLAKAIDERAAAEGITPAEYRVKMAATSPSNKFAPPEDIAFLAAYLANPKSYHINATHIMISGGYLKR